MGVLLQQVRKLILEMIPRLPTNDLLRPYVKPILTLMLKLLQIDNEENVQVCVRIIIELHKQYRPTFNPEVTDICFLCCFCLPPTQLCQDISIIPSLPYPHSVCTFISFPPFPSLLFALLIIIPLPFHSYLSYVKTALVNINGYLMVNTICCMPATWIHVCGACYQDYLLQLTIRIYHNFSINLPTDMFWVVSHLQCLLGCSL